MRKAAWRHSYRRTWRRGPVFGTVAAIAPCSRIVPFDRDTEKSPRRGFLPCISVEYPYPDWPRHLPSSLPRAWVIDVRYLCKHDLLSPLRNLPGCVGVCARWSPQMDARTAQLLVDYGQIRYLDISECVQVDRDLLERLTSLPLAGLNLALCPLRDQDLEPLRRLVSLRRLDLFDIGPSGERIVDICASLPNLTGLSLANCWLTENDLGRIVTLPRLRALRLGHMPLTDRSLEVISRCRTLQLLDLRYTCITDEGLEFLSRTMKQLRVLVLSGCACVTERGIEHLGSLEQLRLLDISETGAPAKRSEDFLRIENKVTKGRRKVTIQTSPIDRNTLWV